MAASPRARTTPTCPKGESLSCKHSSQAARMAASPRVRTTPENARMWQRKKCGEREEVTHNVGEGGWCENACMWQWKKMWGEGGSDAQNG